MPLYLVHCGYYDKQMARGFYETHVNFFVVAKDFKEARKRAKEKKEFLTHQMHIDGIQEIVAVDGYEVHLKSKPKLNEMSQILNERRRGHPPLLVETSKDSF